MSVEAPNALIYGSDNFVSKKLGELLVNRGLSVFWDDEMVGKPLYFFDFGGGEERYEEMGEKRVKVCKIINYELRITNDEFKADKSLDIRLINLYNVYGVGMGGDWWLPKAIDLAAKNKNLILPKVTDKFRLLAVDDAAEAIMRAVIISGTMGKSFEIAGRETDSREVATILIDLAKMTKVEVEEIGEKLQTSNFKEEFENSAKMLRWKPEVDLREGLKPLVAEAVARVDEEGRRGAKKPVTGNWKQELEIEKEPRMGVKVEIENTYELPITPAVAGRANYELKKEEKNDVEISDLRSQISEKKEEMKQEREILVEEEEEIVVGKKIEWQKIEPIKNNYELRRACRQAGITNEIDEEKLQTSNIKKEEEIKEEAGKMKQEGNGRKLGLWVGSGVGIILLIIGMVYGWFLWEAVGVVVSLEKPIKMLEQKQIKEAAALVTKLQSQNKRAKQFWVKTKLGEIIKISDEVLDVEARLCVLSGSMDKINGVIFEEKVADLKTELQSVSNNLVEIEMSAGKVLARLEGVRKWIPGRWRPEVDRVSSLISKNNNMVTKLRQLTLVLPEILGLDGKRREYLVLLQNEMELRATGGFIGSYGILSFQDGRLISFDIKDVYEADGQLKGHVEPPEEIKKYLGEAGWFLRDANWKASFPQATKDIAWFFEKEVGRRVDGVIGVDLAVVKSMLEATGSITVPDFKEKVDKNNLYEQAEFYSESKFFPGSVQKASFLTGVGKQLFLEISTIGASQRWKLLKGLVERLESNDLQIVVNEPNVAGVVADLGWDGEMFGGKCVKVDCYGDYLYVVESNLGVNKANYFLYRNMEQKIDLKETRVERTLRINYENLAKSVNWPGGDYKNYLRIYLPTDVQVSEVTITSEGQVKNVALDEIKMTNVGDKRELGFLVMVPITKKVVVEVKYASAIDQIKDKFSYLLYIQRQPGFGDTGMINLVSMPVGFQPMQVTPLASVVSGKLLFNQKLDKDIKLGVEISK